MTLTQRIALALCGLFLLGACAATFLPSSPQGASCGTWVAPEWTDEATDNLVSQAQDLAEKDFTGQIAGDAYGIAASARLSQRVCSDALSTRRNVSLILLGLAVLGPAAVLFVGGRGAGQTRSKRGETDTVGT